MTRSELLEQFVLNHPQPTHPDVEFAVRYFLDGIAVTLENRAQVEIRGFGSFVIDHMPARTGRNPKTGEAVMVPAKDRPHYRTGKKLGDRINNG